MIDNHNQLNKLLLHIDIINDTHHEHIKSLLLLMKRQNISHAELRQMVNNLNDVMEAYVKEVTLLVDGVKNVSLKYFKETVERLLEENINVK